MFEYITDLLPILTRRIKDYHKMFSLPLIAELWEETLHRSFEELDIETTWKPNRSHTIGEDMRLRNIDNSRISCKSGIWWSANMTVKELKIELKKRGLPRTGKKKDLVDRLTAECGPCQLKVKFNGGRSTRCPTLEDKINHFSQSHDDYYFMLSKKTPFDNTYKLIVFESSICRVDQLNWSESSSGKQWKGTGNFTASIGKSMSAQLWTTLPLNLITHIYDIDCITD